MTIFFGAALARGLGLSLRMGILTGGATAICGASAAIAISAVLPQDDKSERELIFTIAGVTALSTIAMILYPVIVSVTGLAQNQAGIFLGGTIHDVAQVVGAGYSISPERRGGDPLLPLFLVAFLGFVIIGSLGWIPKPVGNALNEVSRACLVVAIAGVGLKTSLVEMKKVGARAIVLLAIEAAFLAVFVLVAQKIH